jgi:sigma-B regulation protein RsbU (phosphoserine phosphatase)
MLSGGPPLCVVRGYAYASGQLDLPRGGWLCVVTDGVTEAMNARFELYGTERLLSVLHGLESAAPDAVIAAVREDVRRFAGSAEQSDDVTLLCVRWSGTPASGH